jgi:hypothetical protein
LILLNDPFVQSEATRWAERLLAEGPAPAPDRIDRLYRRAFGRTASSNEQQQAQAFLESQATRYREVAGATASSSSETGVWSDLCHVLFNVKEFIYLD